MNARQRKVVAFLCDIAKPLYLYYMHASRYDAVEASQRIVDKALNDIDRSIREYVR